MKIEYDSTYILHYIIMHPNYDYGDYASCVSIILTSSGNRQNIMIEQEQDNPDFRCQR